MGGSDYVLVCAESKVSDSRHLSELRICGFGCPNRGRGTPHLMSKVWLFMLEKYSAPSGRASWSVLGMSLVSFVFTIFINYFYKQLKKNMFMTFTVTLSTMVHFMTVPELYSMGTIS